jgi:hypothetical protein
MTSDKMNMEGSDGKRTNVERREFGDKETTLRTTITIT